MANNCTPITKKCKINVNDDIVNIISHVFIHKCIPIIPPNSKQEKIMYDKIYNIFELLSIKEDIIKKIKKKICTKTKTTISEDIPRGHLFNIFDLPNCVYNIRGPASFFYYDSTIIRISTGIPHFALWHIDPKFVKQIIDPNSLFCINKEHFSSTSSSSNILNFGALLFIIFLMHKFIL